MSDRDLLIVEDDDLVGSIVRRVSEPVGQRTVRVAPLTAAGTSLAVRRPFSMLTDRPLPDVRDEHWWGSTTTLAVRITTLRRWVGATFADSGRITAIRSVGYRLEI